MNVTYHPLVKTRDIPRLDTKIAGRVKNAIEQKLSTQPMLYGVPLRNILKRCWKLRVGDWRVVYKIDKSNVAIYAIAHRKEVYDVVKQRI